MSKGRLIAIGDIHGCTDAVKAVLAAIEPKSNDQFVLLGDIVDRGLDTKGTIELLIAFKKQFPLILIRGNHEDMLLASLTSSVEQKAWISFGGVRTLDSYGFGGGVEMIPQEHIEFLQDSVAYHECDDFFFIHANYLPDTPLAEQPPRTARWQFLKQRLPGPHHNGKTAVVGHSAQESFEVLDLGYLRCIDTACAEGGWLTAMDVRSGQIWQANREGSLRTPQESPGA